MGEISPFVASVSTRITRRADEYTAEIDRADRPEQAELEQFTAHAEAILADYDPPSARRHSDSLVFRHLYAAARQPAPDEADWRVPSAIPAALLAAEVEFRGPLRLSSRQNTMLAEEYERLGAQLSAAGLPAHAALAYRRGAALYRMNEDDEAQDRCGLRLARARTLALPPGPRRWPGQLSYVLCGYGYRPFWLLGWVAGQLVLFTVAALLLSGNSSPAATIYTCVTGFINPLGPGDTENLRPAARPLFAVEAWAGTVSMSVFFALLVRKWFRM
ncbi:hypothetical protein [Nocardia arthritidis]|uniref:hypothetical protein n=1 Tax=Nocardia arthritidis TaxID=228602 RepID=UPI0007A4C663|nr:hypothetical protein [Nocardia arthritidis]